MPGLALGGRQKRHHGQGQSGEHDAGDGPLGLSGARGRQDGVDGDVRGEREEREGDDLTTTQRYLHPDAGQITAAGAALSAHLMVLRAPRSLPVTAVTAI
ncbi:MULTISPECIES: hypothetical protein [unclassified Streptomyces]|uniref:hypothetical protein n=1 Tax=unclassified Streptomyces TaxID=2593676 RepID=UPI002250C9B3|nr:hypothetical protein [Streptomyces sp. NBC_01551]MCX4524643.1 hypothetical protein [Streptomyces sp. NBC_01551]